jgi:hypothetical protein
MELPRILVSGKFAPEDLLVSVSPSNRKVDPVIEGQLDALWETKKRLADEQGKKCYNGISYRLNSIQEHDGKVTVDFGTFEYKVRDGLTAIPGYFTLPEEYYRKGCFSIATVKTNDDRYVLVELSGKSMNENTVDLIGGIMETNIVFDSGESIFRSFSNELEEEAGIMEEDIQECFLKTIFITDRTNTAFYFEVILNVSAYDLEERFRENKDQDIRALRFCTRGEYIQVLGQHRSPNKQFIAKELLAL